MPLLALRILGGFFYFFLVPVCEFRKDVDEGFGGRGAGVPAAPAEALPVERRAGPKGFPLFPLVRRQGVEDEKADRAREIAVAVAVDLGHQPVDRDASLLGDGPEPPPERVLQRNRSPVPVDHQGALGDGGRRHVPNLCLCRDESCP